MSNEISNIFSDWESDNLEYDFYEWSEVSSPQIAELEDLMKAYFNKLQSQLEAAKKELDKHQSLNTSYDSFLTEKGLEDAFEEWRKE